MTGAKRRLRVTIDTNVFVSSFIVGAGPTYEILQRWYDAGFVLIMSDDQRNELLEVMQRPRLIRLYQVGQDEQQEFVRVVSALSTAPDAPPPLAVRDPKDETILGAAVAGGADYLITGDADLLVLQAEPAIQPLQIVTPRAFLDLLMNTDD